MQDKLHSFICPLKFKIDLFLPQWWLGVREAWNKNYLEFLVKKVNSNLSDKPQADSLTLLIKLYQL